MLPGLRFVAGNGPEPPIVHPNAGFGSTMNDCSMLHSPELDESGLVADALAREVGRRRTIAINSHPHAGKTTLTEKLLL